MAIKIYFKRKFKPILPNRISSIKFLFGILFFIFCYHNMVRKNYDNTGYENVLDNVKDEELDGINQTKLNAEKNKKNNLIYYGSNAELAGVYNTDEKMVEYRHPRLQYLSRRFPQVICIGVAKAGTTALRYFLKSHPSIVTSKMDEPSFFNNNTLYNTGLDNYLKMMQHSLKWQITLDKTPSYFASENAMRRIYAFDPSMKLLMVVKDPVERSISHYVHFIRRKNKHVTFQEVFYDESGEISSENWAVQASLYNRHYLKWLQTPFSKSQIHIVNGNNLMQNPAVELQKVEQFLQVENYYTQDRIYFNETKGFYCVKVPHNVNGGGHCVGNTRDNVYQELANGENVDIEQFKIQLAEYFKPHNNDFYRMTGVQL